MLEVSSYDWNNLVVLAVMMHILFWVSFFSKYCGNIVVGELQLGFEGYSVQTGTKSNEDSLLEAAMHKYFWPLKIYSPGI